MGSLDGGWGRLEGVKKTALYDCTKELSGQW